MDAYGTDGARRTTRDHPKDHPVPRAKARCRSLRFAGVGFATLLTLAAVRLAAAGYPHTEPPAGDAFVRDLDRDANGVEDLLDAWRDGTATWQDLRDQAVAAPRRAAAAAGKAQADRAEVPAALADVPGPWGMGRIRLLWFDAPSYAIAAADKAAAGGVQLLHDVAPLGLSVVACDEVGLAALLARAGTGRLMLDRDGVPALDASRPLVGVPRVRAPGWSLGRDWSGTVAILDSGCDTAHGDLGDYDDDDVDGPPPAVGDAGDWYPADNGWPLFAGYKVVAWTDVSDDFPQSAGPWDYHYHGTALASVLAGAGNVDPAFAGVAPSLRLSIVKFYDFDVTWHAWAGDFLAACAWVLEHRDVYRIRSVLVAVNWDVDLGIAGAMRALVNGGVTVVAAAGNQGSDPAGPGLPARVPEVLTVGGVNDAGAVAAFSARGLPDQAKPDLLAPSGGLLPEAGRITTADNEPDDTYSGRFGTSLAAAHVAGAAAMLDEALADRGVVLPADREAVLTRCVLLKTTAAPVGFAETADGSGAVALTPWSAPDPVQGWGLLRIDAAVQAACEPLMPGVDQLDTLASDFSRPVAARRLVTAPGVRYLVEAVPSNGLDILLEIVDPVGVVTGEDDASLRRNEGGAGISEFAYVRPAAAHWLSVVVKRRAGSGTVMLRLREADSFADQGFRVKLPGRLTGAPNFGHLGFDLQPSLVVGSLVAVDDAARAVTVLNPDGSIRPRWPVYIFPPVSSQGGLGLPLVWDLDDQPGDEIVFASDYGSMVFFNANGGRIIVNLDFNVRLTPPVGLEGPRERLVTSVDQRGTVRAWAAGGNLRAVRPLGHVAPLTPAAGRIVRGGPEALVVAFGGGRITALDADLADLPGWPRELGQTLSGAPVLVDFDDDGDKEIVLVGLDPLSKLATMRVFDGGGEPAPGDGVVLATPAGGPWVALGPAVVTGRYGTGDLGVTMLGLASNGSTGAAAAWTLVQATLRADGTATAATVPGLDIRATTSEGVLVLDRSLLPAPVTWNILGGTGTEPVGLLSLGWTELLYGLTAIPGATTAWYLPNLRGRPLATWMPVARGGPDAAAPGAAATMLVPGDAGAHLRIDVLDQQLTAMPVPAGPGAQPVWLSSRGDGRNSGAYPFSAPISATGPLAAAGRLAVFPNPGAGRFRFRVPGDVAGPVRAEIYDVRGRCVRRLEAAAFGDLVWDGRGHDGRFTAAGTYFAVVRAAGRSWSSRLVLAR